MSEELHNNYDHSEETPDNAETVTGNEEIVNETDGVSEAVEEAAPESETVTVNEEIVNETDGASAAAEEAAPEAETVIEKASEAPAAPAADENGWVWFNSPAEQAESAEAEAPSAGTGYGPEVSAPETGEASYTQPEIKNEYKAYEGPKADARKKEKKSSGRGTKAYLAALTAALLAVAVMLGFCIFKLNGIEEKKDTGSTVPTITVADSSADKIKNSDNSEQEPALTVQHSENGAYAGDNDLTALYNESSKSCVSIICTVTVSGGFFGSSYEAQSLGSGFVIDKSGYIVTNHHVIEDSKDITVQFYDGEQVEAELIGSDETCDLAVLKISTERELYPVTFGDSDKVQIGQKVYAIGTPSSIKLAGTLTYGVISGVKREVSLTNDTGSVVKTMTLIQTDATLNPGNSGGPLFNMKGEVIGINTLKLSSTYEGIGFSIPSTGAVEVINDLIENGKVSTPGGSYVKGMAKLGIEGATVNDASIRNYNLPQSVPKGVYVATVSRKSAVYKEGLSAEDIITEFNGKKVETIEELKSYLAECRAGETATIKYYRLDRRDETKGEYFEITFKLDAQS